MRESVSRREKEKRRQKGNGEAEGDYKPFATGAAVTAQWSRGLTGDLGFDSQHP